MAVKKGGRWAELVETGPGTPMGRYLRKFWQPVAISAELAPGEKTTLRVMSEDLTMYRGQSGKPYIVAERCAHRGTALETGWVEEDCIRCLYHGWKYDGTGQCVEMPAETDSFVQKVRIRAHPARDYGGLIFAYLGSDEAPEFFPKPELDAEGYQWTNLQVWNCNWFQHMENSFDGLHISYVHRNGPLGRSVSTEVPKLEYEETDWGLIQRAIRSDNVRVSEFHWPNCNHVVAPMVSVGEKPVWVDTFAWKVPVDDEHIALIGVHRAPVTGDAAKRFEEGLVATGHYDAERHIATYDPSHHHDDVLKRRNMPEDGLFRIMAEDYIAIMRQGPIVDRAEERLGQSDAGVIFLRKVFWRELDALKAGRPSKAWKAHPGLAELPMPPNAALAAAR